MAPFQRAQRESYEMKIENPRDKYVLVFDWGNTLMKVFPQYQGPMADWPEVDPVDGVIEALDNLFARHTMVVATNAEESDASLVWKALERAGLGKYFQAVFTSRELGSQKPALEFFRQLESVLGRPANQIALVGDSYQGDILGAKAAGWQAVWYNPARRAVPGSVPFHDGEVSSMKDVPEALERLNLPDYATCLAWLIERDPPYNILAHVQIVAAAAYLLAVWLLEREVAADPVLTHRGGLLHDLGKIDSIRMGQGQGRQDHAALAYERLLARQQPQLAEIANRHMIYQDPAYARRPRTWEERLVYFADKLIEQNRPVAIQERIAGLKNRYPASAQEIEDSLPVLLEHERDICALLETSPADLIKRLQERLGF